MHNDLWAGYKSAVFDTFPDLKFEKQHESWTNKRGVNLTADLYSGKYLLLANEWILDIRPIK